MFNKIKTQLTLLVVIGCFSTTYGQIYVNGKDVMIGAKEYIAATSVLSVPITVFKASEPKTYWSLNTNNAKDTTGSWISKSDMSASKKMKASESYMVEMFDKNQMRDSTGKVIEIGNELDLYNLLSENGYEFLRKDPPVPLTLSKIMMSFTIYHFRRKSK